MEPKRWSFLLPCALETTTPLPCPRPQTSSTAPSIVSLDLNNPISTFLQTAPPSPARSLPAPIGDTWPPPPPPPPELLLPMAENHVQYCKLFKTCSVVATNYDGRFPFIAFMSRHFQRSYVRPPQTVFHVSPMPKSYHFKDRSQLHPHVPPALF